MFRHLGDHVEDERWLSQREGGWVLMILCVFPLLEPSSGSYCARLKTGGSDRSHLQDIVPLFISDSGAYTLHTTL